MFIQRSVTRTLAMSAIVLTALGTSACSAGGDADPDAQDSAESAETEGPAEEADLYAHEEGALPTPAVIDKAGCAFVEFCNAPGSDGTRCVQQACSLAAARVECRSDTAFVCGSPTNPWRIRTLDGQILPVNPGPTPQ
jgi:hypothetical protein